VSAEGFTVWTHRELLEEKPTAREYRPAGDCAGVYRVADTTERVWSARCDVCDDELGIPPRDQDSIIAQLRTLAGGS
jgi:hypothetical protein